jgi:hypothetical protein
MENQWHSGDLSDLPFPFLLFRIWNHRLSGTLEIESNPQGKALDFKNGELSIAADLIEAHDSPLRLRDRIPEKAALYGKDRPLKDQLEADVLTPEELWKDLTFISREDFIPFFDLPAAPYTFHSRQGREEHDILFYISSVDLILDGIRRMTDFALIETHLPDQDKSLKLLFPGYLKRIPLSPPEIYVYHIVKNRKTLKDIYTASRLGKKQTQKILYAFFALGITGLPKTSILSHDKREVSQAEIHHLLESFNRTFAFIFKYISKEIGPASLNVLEKCVEDAKPTLSSLCQNLRFDLEGRIDISSLPVTSASVQGKHVKQVLLQDLNEILAAEVLAVKKILGNDHEAELIKHLEKLNGWN